MEILISYAPYRHQRYSSTNSLKRTAVCMVKERVCFPYEFTLLSNVAATCTTDGKFVSPTNLHCSQTYKQTKCHSLPFVSPTNLHCSQTVVGACVPTAQFVSPTNLHCSQTPSDEFLHVLEFVSPTNLHCSQTIVLVLSLFIGLFPLRIYTALKQSLLIGLNGDSLFPLRIYTALKLISCKYIRKTVCFPYEFTLLSNNVSTAFYLCLVCFPYEFTLLSNCAYYHNLKFEFVSPTNLHCSQTYITFLWYPDSFVSPTNLHCSQTVYHSHSRSPRFVSPTNLHCSQTSNRPRIIFCKIPVSLHRSYHSSLY